MSITDSQFLEWTRAKISGPLNDRDLDLSKDVRLCQLMLYALVRYADARTIVEIGAGDGSTTIPLLKGAEETNGIVHSVDPAPCLDAVRLVTAFEYLPCWRFHNETSAQFFSHFGDKIDLAFIDGDHRPDYVRIDALQVFARLKPNGFCVFHDWHVTSDEVMANSADPYSLGVQKALCEVLPQVRPVHSIPLWPQGKPFGNGSEPPILVFQKASDVAQLDFVRAHVWY